MSYIFAFSYCSWGFQGKNTEVFCHSLLQWATFLSELSTMTCPSWVDLHDMAPSFIELDKEPLDVKKENEKAGLKFNIQKTKIMAPGPITSWQIDG